jgi:peptide/nickel transport system substrate-binding protein
MIETERGITRRDALRYGGAGVAALMTPTLLAACGGSSDSSAKAIKGPVISAQSLAATTLDPHTAAQIAGITIVLYAYEGLYGKSPQPPYDVEPQLATGDPEEVGADAVRVKLRAGATFHDGSPVTPKDVAASFQRVLDPDTASLLAGYLSMVDRVEPDGADAVLIELKFPSALLRDRLALVKIMPAALAAEKPGARVFNAKPVGSGPYRITSVSNDLRAVRMERFDGYEGPVDVALEEIGLDSIPDDQARVAALQTNRIAAMVDPPFSGIDRLNDQPAIDAGGKLSFQQSILMFNNGKKPFDDPRVRRAIFHAIDREAITKAVFFGHAEAATSFLPTNNPDYKKPTTSLAYDPEQARSLLAEAGVPNLDFHINLNNLGWLTPQAPLLQSQLEAVGINVTIRQGETESLVKYVTDGSYDSWFTVTDPSVFGNNDGEFLIQWVYGNLASFMYWTDPASKRMAGLIDRAVHSTSDAEVKQLVGTMQDLIAQEAPAFPLHHRDATAAWSTGVDLDIDPVYGVNLLEARLAG